MAQQNTLEKCPICREDFKNEHEKCKLDCKHIFHSHCIITWFRSGNNTCPSCRGTQDYAMSFADVKTRAKMVKQYAKTKKASPTLKKIIARNTMIRKNARKTTKLLNDYKKSKEVKEVLNKMARLERKKKYWKNLQEVYTRVLGLYTDEKLHIPPVVSYYPVLT